LSIKRKEIHGIVGLSGAGKSTLLKLIGGFLDYSAGSISFQGKKIVGPSYKLIAGYEDIQLVNQDYALDLHHSVRENIRVQAQHLTFQDREEVVEELLELFLLKELEHLKAYQLSGGEQQRLALARALAKEPKILLLDEPFAHVDIHLKPRIINYLLKLRDVRGVAILLVTHNGSEAMAICDKVHFLKNSSIVRSATPKEFYYQPTDSFEGAFFGEINDLVVNRKRIIFRPNEYSLDGINEEAVSVKFVRAIFQGTFYANYFKTKKREEVVLYASESLSEITQFWLTTNLPNKSH
jgi:iron(III) transport system ATP-binding protein